MITVSQLLARKGRRTVYSIDAEEPVLEAIRIMADQHIGALLVMKGKTLVGILSERDYARKVILLGRSSSETPAWQIMSAPVQTVTPAMTLDECMRLMTERRIRHLPVLDGDRIAGVISIGDLVKALIEDQRQTIEQLENYIHS
jgi:CBS domain-containing protein